MVLDLDAIKDAAYRVQDSVDVGAAVRHDNRTILALCAEIERLRAEEQRLWASIRDYQRELGLID